MHCLKNIFSNWWVSLFFKDIRIGTERVLTNTRTVTHQVDISGIKEVKTQRRLEIINIKLQKPENDLTLLLSNFNQHSLEHQLHLHLHYYSGTDTYCNTLVYEIVASLSI